MTWLNSVHLIFVTSILVYYKEFNQLKCNGEIHKIIYFVWLLQSVLSHIALIYQY